MTREIYFAGRLVNGLPGSGPGTIQLFFTKREIKQISKNHPLK
jgi:hypothetical protein